MGYSKIGVVGGRCALIYEESHDEHKGGVQYGKKHGYIQFDVPDSKIDEFIKAVESSESEDEFFIRLQFNNESD